MADIRVGDVGTAMVVAIVDENGVAVDVSAATERKIYLTPPGLPPVTPLAFTAVNDTDGVNGKIKYVTQGVLVDLSKSGEWLIEGFAAVGSSAWSTQQSPLTVAKSSRYPTL